MEDGIMTDRELMQMALGALEEAADHVYCPGDDDAIGVTRKALHARLAQPEPQEIEIRFTEWLHPQMGVVPVDPETPLILKARIALPSP
jgi:hypothetical protein